MMILVMFTSCGCVLPCQGWQGDGDGDGDGNCTFRNRQFSIAV